LGDGGEYGLSKNQRFLLKCWQDVTRRMRRLKPNVVALLGDVIQGVSIRDGQLVTNRTDIQKNAAFKLLEPWRECTKQFYMIKGTPWHEGKASESLGMLGDMLNAEIDPASGERGWWEVNLRLPGGDMPIVNLSHHIGATRVSWYEATVPLRDMLMMLSEQARMYKKKAPNVRLVVRAHRHRCIGVWVAPDLQVWTTGTWQLRTAYAYKKGMVTYPHLSYLMIEWDGKDLVVKPRIYSPPLPHIEEAQV